MKLFSKKQLKRLQPYEEHFKTVVYAKYKRATSSKVNDIVADIYEELTGKPLTRNWSCSQCVYKVFESAGKIYYKSLEELNKETNDRN